MHYVRGAGAEEAEDATARHLEIVTVSADAGQDSCALLSMSLRVFGPWTVLRYVQLSH